MHLITIHICQFFISVTSTSGLTSSLILRTFHYAYTRFDMFLAKKNHANII